MNNKLTIEELTTLVVQSQAGNLNAYSKIVRNFQDMAVGYAYSIVGSFQLAVNRRGCAFRDADPASVPATVLAAIARAVPIGFPRRDPCGHARRW